VHPRQQQKAVIVEHQVQIALTLGTRPANEAVPVGERPSAGAKAQQNYLAELESSLILFYTGVSRESANITNEQVENMKSGNKISLQAMHDLKAEALHMKDAFLKGDLDAVVTAMQASWKAKKNMARATVIRS
jgi:galactokinase/mevalonate kinase-like predicted kinase